MFDKYSMYMFHQPRRKPAGGWKDWYPETSKLSHHYQQRMRRTVVVWDTENIYTYIYIYIIYLAANLPTSGNCGGRCVCVVVLGGCKMEIVILSLNLLQKNK